MNRLSRIQAAAAVLLLAAGPVRLMAYDFMEPHGGVNIYYNVGDSANGELTASVTYGTRLSTSRRTDYAGDIVVPDRVIHDDTLYLVTSIGAGAFQACHSVSSVTLPSTIERIEQRAFQSCDSLTAMVLPPSVSYVGDNAFMACSRLQQVNIPAGLSGVGNMAFSGTAMSGLLMTDSLFIYCPSGQRGMFSVPDGIEAIAPGAFADQAGLTGVCLPPSVRHVGANAFVRCSGLRWVNLPDGLEDVGDYAFSADSALQSVVFPGSLQSVGTSAFAKSGLQQVVIPATLTHIGSSAFADCFRLESAVFLKPAVSVPERMFWSCGQLRQVVLPNTLQSIELGAFTMCGSLEEIYIPNSVSRIGGAAFQECTSLRRVHLPDSLRVIPNACFDRCSSLGSIDLPAGITAIEQYAFWRSGLEQVCLPRTLTAVERNAFDECDRLQLITCLSDVPPVAQSSSFGRYDRTLKVFCHAVEAYRQPGVFSQFRYVECINGWFQIDVLSADSAQGITTCGGSYEYGSSATLGAVAYPGYRFSHWSDGSTENPRTVKVESDSVLVAWFEATEAALLSVSHLPGISVSHGQIMVAGDVVEPVGVFDASGKLVSVATAGSCIRLNAGIYLVRMGMAAEKVRVD